MDALRYVLRGGIAWRALPHDSPPWQTVYHSFRMWQLDGVEVGRVGREKDQASPGGFDGGAWPRTLVHIEVVEDDEVAGTEGGGQDLLDEGGEGGAINGSRHDHTGTDARRGQRGQPRGGLPPAAWDAAHRPHPARGAGAQRCEGCRRVRFVEKDEPRRIHGEHLRPPGRPRRLIPFRRNHRFF